MISVTYPIWYSNQDFDEQQALYADLQAHPQDYLTHADGTVRSLADWTMEWFKLRNLRPDVAYSAGKGRLKLKALYGRLQQLSVSAANA
jgi:hypothetical protein